MHFTAYPIELAYSGKCCVKCCETDAKLLKCVSCKQAHYCSRNCQKADWKDHKVECKLLRLFKLGYESFPGGMEERHQKAHAFLKAMPLMIQEGLVFNEITLEQFQKASTTRFSKFVVSTRVCCICLRNDFQDSAEPIDWKYCPKCKFGWCCGEEHWQEYKDKHSPEICQNFQHSMAVTLFLFQHLTNNDESFVFAPDGQMSTTPASFPANWGAYFRSRCPVQYSYKDQLPPEFFPASTYLLSQPLTCLYALYKHDSSNVSNLKDLTVHIVGASDYEVPATCIWEEILHFLPNLQCLTVQFIGPEACKSLKPLTQDFATIKMDPCPDCQSQNRQRRVGMFGYTYHEYAEKYLKGNRDHKKPDLIVGFNTGMHENDTKSWTRSLQVMLDMNVPAYFTSYNESEAIQDLALLQKGSANVLQDGVKRNPFGQDYWTVEPPNTELGADKFYACNQYGVLFCGRS